MCFSSNATLFPVHFSGTGPQLLKHPGFLMPILEILKRGLE
jgi:hypothetical protein